MSMTTNRLDVVKSLLKGPGIFIVSYALVVLSPLLLVRMLGIEHKGGQLDLALGSGMVAFMILITAFFFSGRFEWLNGKRGMDLMLKFHRRIVFVSLALIVLHVVLVAPHAMPDKMWPVVLAFLLVVVVIGMAKSRQKTKIKYEKWRLLHGLMACIVLGLVCFHALSEGRYSDHSIVVAFWITCTLLAISSLPYVHAYLPRNSMKSPYKVTSVIKSAEKQWTVEIEPEGFQAMNFYPGQFAFVAFHSKNSRKPNFHPFSFSSSPSERPKIAFTIKETGDFTETVSDLQVGSSVYLDGPYGYMTRDLHRGPENRGRGVVLLAAGIGITPMISMLREMEATKDNTPVKLFYACRHEDDFLYRDELEKLKDDLNLELHMILSQPSGSWPGETGRLDEGYLTEKIQFPNYDEYLYFVCGTTSFVKSTVKNIDSLPGIPIYNIRYEDFSVYN